jgi:hypothetical protein
VNQSFPKVYGQIAEGSLKKSLSNSVFHREGIANTEHRKSRIYRKKQPGNGCFNGFVIIPE